MFRLAKRIDISNSAELEKELMDLKPDKLDASELEYISSSGLRALLKLSKEIPDKLKITNVSPQTYEIFEATGFTDLMDVRKRLREVSVDGMELIGKGGWGRVYRMDDETVIKVYDSPKNLTSPSKAEQEVRISREVFKRGIPTAISFDMVRCGDYNAAVIEKITGKTLGEIIGEDPDKTEEMMSRFAKIGRLVHSTDAPRDVFPDAISMIKVEDSEKWMSYWLTKEELDHWNKLWDVIPDRDKMVHTDYHYDNAIMQDDELILIDVGGVAHGHPIVDFVSMYIWAYHPEIVKTRFTPELNKRVFDSYVNAYFGDRLNDDNRKVLFEVFEFICEMIMSTISAIRAATMLDHPPSEDEKTKVRTVLKKVIDLDPDRIRNDFAIIDKELF